MSDDFTLLTSQRNLAFEDIRKLGLDPSEFSWAKVTSSY